MKCLYCEKTYSEKITFNNLFTKHYSLCSACKNTLTINYYEHNNIKLYYFAEYEEIKNIIYNIKYFGDVQSAQKFKYHFELFFENNCFDTITVAPTNIVRESIRGFNPSSIILKLVNIPYIDIFQTKYREKQAKLHQKRTIHNVSIAKDRIEKIKNIKKLLIFDDIYTSGKTLNSLANCIRTVNPNIEIIFLTLAKTKIK